MRGGLWPLPALTGRSSGAVAAQRRSRKRTLNRFHSKARIIMVVTRDFSSIAAVVINVVCRLDRGLAAPGGQRKEADWSVRQPMLRHSFGSGLSKLMATLGLDAMVLSQIAASGEELVEHFF